jgi:hypothetical protein
MGDAMTFTITLPDWSPQVWIVVGISLYVLLSYAFMGRWVARSVWRWEHGAAGCNADGGSAVIVYILSPVSWPVYCLVWLFACVPWERIVFGPPPR